MVHAFKFHAVVSRILFVMFGTKVVFTFFYALCMLVTTMYSHSTRHMISDTSSTTSRYTTRAGKVALGAHISFRPILHSIGEVWRDRLANWRPLITDAQRLISQKFKTTCQQRRRLVSLYICYYVIYYELRQIICFQPKRRKESQ